MPLVERLKKRGTTITVYANGELLFAPGGQIDQWNRRFSRSMRRFAAMEAPSNKRPRWMHYGKPLKATMRASTDINPSTMQAHAAVGSTAAHAAYVDQGTGIHAGNSPYPAKILPPWKQGSPSLYEHTWRPPNSSPSGWSKVPEVMIRGQKGQFFFAEALSKGLRAARLPSIEVPESALGLDTFPERLANFQGNTPFSFAFDTQLRIWRSWRDAAFNRGDLLGEGGGRRRRTRNSRARYRRTPTTDAQRRAMSAARSRKYRQRVKDDSAKDLSVSPEVAKTARDQKKLENTARAEVSIAKAKAIRAKADLIAAERKATLDSVQADALAKGYRVTVSQRMKVDGLYQYRLDYVGITSGRRLTYWAVSNFQ